MVYGEYGLYSSGLVQVKRQGVGEMPLRVITILGFAEQEVDFCLGIQHKSDLDP